MNRTIKYVLSIIATVLLLISVSGCGSSSDPSASSIKLESGKVVSFAEDIAGGGENGWSIPDNGGTWSQADSAILNLEYDKSWNNGLNLVLSLMSFVNVQNPNVTVSVKANDEFVKELNFDEAKPSEEVSIDISKDILSKKSGRVILTFDITNAAIPKELGTGADERKLGIFLLQMVATPLP